MLEKYNNKNFDLEKMLGKLQSKDLNDKQKIYLYLMMEKKLMLMQ